MRNLTILLIAMLAVSAVAGEAAEEKPGVKLTVYNKNFAVVKERRHIELQQGRSTVRFRDVAATIDATSVHFKSLTDPDGTTILEQNYEFDLVSADKLLKKYIDQQVAILTKDGRIYEGKLMSYDGAQIVIQGAKGGLSMIQRGENIKSIKFGSLPEGLLTKPTLVWQVNAAKGGRHLVKLSYVANNISWKVDYTAVANADDTKVDLSGWVTITNRAGTTYKDAKIKLLAGQVSGRRDRFGWGPEYFKQISQLPPTAERGPDPGKVFGEYHLYKLPEPSTVNNNQVKQIELINATGVTATKKYIYDGAKISWSPYRRSEDRNFGTQSNKKVNVLLEIENRKAHGLGFALPAGKVRVYKRDDADKSLEFIGEDKIAHTPRDEKLVLYVGDAFDVVGERKQTDFKKPAHRVIEEAFEIKLRNHKEQDVNVKVVEKLYRWSQWEIIEKNHDFTKLDSRTIAFDVKVPKDAERVITYRVRYTW